MVRSYSASRSKSCSLSQPSTQRSGVVVFIHADLSSVSVIATIARVPRRSIIQRRVLASMARFRSLHSSHSAEPKSSSTYSARYSERRCCVPCLSTNAKSVAISPTLLRFSSSSFLLVQVYLYPLLWRRKR